MCPSGNSKSTTVEDETPDKPPARDTKKSHSETVPVREAEDQEETKSIDESSDDISDPIVVSPERAPSSPEHQEPEEEIFEDAKVAPELPQSPSFVVAGLQRKASPWVIKPWAALALTLDGRDKITKVFQYAARFLGWWFAGGPHKNESVRFTSLYKSLALSRKAFRLGRSFIEFDKLRSMGLAGLIFWHIQNTLEGGNVENNNSPKPPKTVVRRASSNIGWGPMTFDDEQESLSRPSLIRSLSNVAYRRMYRPLLSRMASNLASSDAPSEELWIALGNSIKMLGLLGFWAGDNVNFLSSSGALDDYSLPNKERLERRKRWQTVSGELASQAYFVGSLAGLLVNSYAYIRFRRDKLEKAERHLREAIEESLEDQDRCIQQLKNVKEKQFALFLALLKSCCDVMVFSNNPGVDLHKKFRGKKNNEGFHCICGLISAGTVIYNNFPDSK